MIEVDFPSRNNPLGTPVMSDEKKPSLSAAAAGAWMISMPFVAGFMLLMGFAWYEEKSYDWWGEETQAQVVDVKVEKHYRRRGRSYQDLRVSFQFQDQGTTRNEKVNLPSDSDFPPAVGDKIPIEYVPGKAKYARIQGMNRSLEITILYILLAYSVLGAAMTVFLLRRYVPESPANPVRSRYRR